MTNCSVVRGLPAGLSPIPTSLGGVSLLGEPAYLGSLVAYWYVGFRSRCARCAAWTSTWAASSWLPSKSSGWALTSGPQLHRVTRVLQRQVIHHLLQPLPTLLPESPRPQAVLLPLQGPRHQLQAVEEVGARLLVQLLQSASRHLVQRMVVVQLQNLLGVYCGCSLWRPAPLVRSSVHSMGLR